MTRSNLLSFAFAVLLCGTWFAYAEWHGIIPPPWCIANPLNDGVVK